MASTDALDEQRYAAATANRLQAAEMFATLTPEQWRTPSLCAGWTVREVAAHLLQAVETRFTWPRLVWGVVRYGGSLDRMVDRRARADAARPTEEIVAGLRQHAARRLDPPVIGPAGPMTDSFIHLRDAARPLGLDTCPPADSWPLVLDFLVSPRATLAGFVGRGRLTGLSLTATDSDWTWADHGEAPEVRGTGEALALAVAGRSVAMADLTGHGAEVLGARLST